MRNISNIDSVIANGQMQPLVLIESKYIRYKKHNRDKGSWICTAHYSLRRTYPTVRKSIAVIAGNWSGSSKAMMESFDVTLFEVGFQRIVDTLGRFGVDIEWSEKDRNRAMTAWENWQRLTEDQYSEIAQTLLAEIEPPLRKTIAATINTAAPREVSEVELIIETSLGESLRYTFQSVSEAIEFLEDFDEETMLNDTNGPTLWSAQSGTALANDREDKE